MTESRHVWASLLAGALALVALAGCTAPEDEPPTPTVESSSPPPTQGPSPTETTAPTTARTQLEDRILVAMENAAMGPAGPAEQNFGETALLSGRWADGGVLVFAYSSPEFAPPRETVSSTELNGVPASVVVDEGAAPSVRFVCLDFAVDVTALDLNATPLKDQVVVLAAAEALRNELEC